MIRLNFNKLAYGIPLNTSSSSPFDYEKKSEWRRIVALPSAINPISLSRMMPIVCMYLLLFIVRKYFFRV